MKKSILPIISILKKLRASKKLFFLSLIVFVIFTSAEAGDMKKKGRNMDNPFGVLEFLHWNHPWNNYKYSCVKDLEKVVALMRQAGVGWVRMDFLWEEIEPTPGKFNFVKYDQIVDVLTRNNIQILALLDYSADWAKSCPEWNCPPKENKLFVDYAVRIIAHYKDKIKYWEIWNEPDSYTYWSNQDGLIGYCALLKDVYIAAKKVDPECRILNGGLANGLSSVNRLYENGTKDYFDILNIHTFLNPLHVNAVKSLDVYPKLAYKIMARNGDGDKKIWITEIGCPGVKEGIQVNNWWMGNNPDERKQAEWLDNVYGELLKDKNVEKVFWAFFRDCDAHWSNGIDFFGLVRWDFSKKPAFKSFQKFIREWKNNKTSP